MTEFREHGVIFESFLFAPWGKIRDMRWKASNDRVLFLQYRGVKRNLRIPDEHRAEVDRLLERFAAATK